MPEIKTIAGAIGVGVFILILIYVYNKLIRLRYGVRTAWSDIDVQLKKRYDLLPNLVSIVKGYATHEKDTLTKVAELRSAAMGASGPEKKARAENMLAGALKSLFAVVESYPALKADKHFQELMETLKNVEGDIELSRRHYNAAVRDYNVCIEVFPTNIAAAAFSFGPEEFFSLGSESEERKGVKVDLGA